MNLSAIASFHPAQSLYRSEAANQVDPVQKAFTNASERLQKARDVTTEFERKIRTSLEP